MVTMMEQFTSQERRSSQTSEAALTGTPSRRARYQMASKSGPRQLLHHQRSVGHYDAEDEDDEAAVVVGTGSDTIRTSDRTSAAAIANVTTSKISSSPNRCNLSKLRAEAFLKPVHPSGTSNESESVPASSVNTNQSESSSAASADIVPDTNVTSQKSQET